MSLVLTQAAAGVGVRGDIFWDLPPWLNYSPGYDLGCHIYVANPTEEDRGYALIAELASGSTVISEEALPVFGYTRFEVEAGDFIELDGSLRFDSSNVVLTVKLVDPETSEVIDAVATMLVAPGNSASALPPPWPGSAGVATGETDWTSLMGFIMPLLMLVMLTAMLAPAGKPQGENASAARSND